jgi:tRNA/rRNA methyltransferase
MTSDDLPTPDPRSPAIILVRPQMGENIGAAARVMWNFGLHDLRIVDPREAWPNSRAIAMASGASRVLDEARLYPDTASALRDIDLVLAATARKRDIEKDVHGPRAAIGLLRTVAEEQRVALMFGGERAGLDNDDVLLADAIVTLPVNPLFHSLNLAQTVATLCYEWRVSETDAPPPRFEHARGEPAPREEFEGLIAQIEEEAEAAGYYRPPEKAPTMKRNIRAALQRARFTPQEVRTMRGLVKALAHWRGEATRPKRGE